MYPHFESISANRIYEHVCKIAAFGPRADGDPIDQLVVDYVSGEFSNLSLDEKVQKVPCCYVDRITASLKLTRPISEDIRCITGCVAGLTDSSGVVGELVFINKGFDEDYFNKDVKDKVVIAWQEHYWEKGDLPVDKVHRAYEHGATGMIFAMKRRDDLLTGWGLGKDPAPIPFLSISYPDFMKITDLMTTNKVEASIHVSGILRDSESTNIWTVIDGTKSTSAIIGIGSCHHETVPSCPGANDNASGIAVMLELAKYFKEHPLPLSILLLCNGGEETGLWGAKAFVDTNYDWLSKSLKAMMMVDQIGSSDPMVYSGGTRWLEECWVEEAEKLGYRLIHCFDSIIDYPGALGDADPFLKRGLPVAQAGAWPTDFFYHTVEDTPEKICPNGLKAVAETIAAVAIRISEEN